MTQFIPGVGQKADDKNCNTAFSKRLAQKIKDHKPEALLWDITPVVANAILVWNDKNRTMSRARVNSYTDTMREGRWIDRSGETISFSNIRLINGQHTCASVIKSGATIQEWVIFGVPDEAFKVVDTGKVRTAADVFKIEEVHNYSKAAAITKWLRQHELGYIAQGGGGTTMSNDVLYEFYLQHSGEIDESVSVSALFNRKKLCSGSIIGGVYALCARKNKMLADDFFQKVGEGYGIARRSPAAQLRDRLLADITNSAQGQGRMGRRTLAGVFIKAWNAERTNKTIPKNQLTLTADEPFPTVV